MRHGLFAMLTFALVVASTPSEAQESEAAEKPESKSAPRAKPGQQYTFYGVRLLEQDPNITDEEKLKEWQAFIARAEEQIRYAKKAVVRWKNAARERLIAAAQKSDVDPALAPVDKIDQWKEVARLYPRTAQARKAKKRAAYWTAQETKARVEAAEEVEKARRPKVERILAWVKVLEWVKKGPEARAAQRRIDALQRQLFAEAQSVDRISRVPKKTKLDAWRDVLEGRPTPQQKRLAEKRVADLESQFRAEKATLEASGGDSSVQ